MLFQKIVLIDDDTEDHEIFKTALNLVSEKSECITFTDARQVLEQLHRKKISPDIIFLDLNMPMMTGQDFLKEVKKNGDTQKIPVIIFSTTSNPATVKLTKELGAVDFITKPDRFDTLVDILKAIMNENK